VFDLSGATPADEWRVRVTNPIGSFGELEVSVQ
jgi:hypothetical protein